MKFSSQLLFLYIVTIAARLTFTCSQSRVDRSPSLHLRRNRRFFTFLKTSTFSVGMAMAKRVVTPSPSATNIVIGIGNAYDLPSSIDDWRPKFLRTHAKPKPKPPPKLSQADHVHHEHLIYDDDSSWHSFDHHHGDVVLDSKPMVEALPWKQKTPHRKIWTNRPSYKDIIETPPIMSHFAGKDHHIPMNILKMGTNSHDPHISETIPIQNEWFLSNGHKEKRRIFNSIEKFAAKFGMDLKSCILRAICEAKHFLLPPGKSLIQDVIRILFGMPPKSHIEDEYSKATRHDPEDCKGLYEDECPISIIELAVNSHVKGSKS